MKNNSKENTKQPSQKEKAPEGFEDLLSRAFDDQKEQQKKKEQR